MLKKLAWNTFKNTGSIDTMMELLEVSNIESKIEEENKINKKGIIDGNNQNKGNSIT